MRSALAALVVLAGLSCAETPPAAPQDDARYWVEVCAAHGYSQVETAMATGREAPEVAWLQSRIRPAARPADRLLLLPYPGGRHPRIGFLEGAVDRARNSMGFYIFSPFFLCHPGGLRTDTSSVR